MEDKEKRITLLGLIKQEEDIGFLGLIISICQAKVAMLRAINEFWENKKEQN